MHCVYINCLKNTSLLYHGREHAKYNVTKQVVRGCNTERVKTPNRYTTRHYSGAMRAGGVSCGAHGQLPNMAREAMLDVGQQHCTDYDIV